MNDKLSKALRCILLNDDTSLACINCPYHDILPCNVRKVIEDVADLEQRIPRWISVEERLPEENVPVLVWELQGFAYVDVYKDGAWEVGTPNLAKFTHWMPIPPKEEEDAEVH